MPHALLLVDGNNLLHAAAQAGELSLADFALARSSLVRMIDAALDTIAHRACVVFDGKVPTPTAHGLSQPDIEVLFSPPDQTADALIARMASRSIAPADVLVVTSDRIEREAVEAAGAMVVSCVQFLDLLRQARSRTSFALRHRSRRPSGSSLGDFFPS